METSLPEYILAAPKGTEPAESDAIILINIAYRPKPKGTAQGGPNGVLLLKENLLGTRYRDCILEYAYEPEDIELPTNLKDWMSKNPIGTISKKLVEADYYLQNILLKEIKKTHGNNTIHFICHDIGSAAAACLTGTPYTLVYHQQGSFLHERKSFGENLNATEEYLINRFEKIAFEGAEEIYFPSDGAKTAFIQTTKLAKPENLKYGKFPLYNSIVDFPISKNAVEFFFISMGYSHILNHTQRENYIIYITVGDYTPNKGVDRCPKLLTQLANNASKKILWIALGSKHKSGIYEKLLSEKSNFPFESIIVPNRQAHELTMGLIQFSDWFLMLQRYSIFDFSTLEAFKLNKGVILSPVGGNLEFNICDNILFYDPQKDDSNQINRIKNASSLEYGRKNGEVFSSSFSPTQFKQRYTKLYDGIIDKKYNYCINYGFDDKTAKHIKVNLHGKKVIICGPGASLHRLSPSEYQDKVLIALNSALLHNAPFTVHIMQDEPSDPLLWDKYLSKDNLLRIYGIIQRPRTKNLSINFQYLKTKNIDFSNYYLAKTPFSAESGALDFDLLNQPVHDLQGVLFSALQIATWAEVASIELAGIDFSKNNINNTSNPNKYNANSLDHLKIATDFIRKKLPIKVLHSDSAHVISIVNQGPTPHPDGTNCNINKKISHLNTLRSLCKRGLYAELINAFQLNHSPAYYTNPTYILLLAQAYHGNSDKSNALLCLKSYKKFGGSQKKHNTLFIKIIFHPKYLKSYFRPAHNSNMLQNKLKIS